MVHRIRVSFVLVKLSEGDLNGVGAERMIQVTDRTMLTNVGKLMIYHLRIELTYKLSNFSFSSFLVEFHVLLS